MTPEQEFIQCFERMHELCKDNDWGDPFSYNRAKEIYTALFLNHQVSTKFSGADAYDSDGECEYKSTTTKSINGTYNGISVQDTWDEQVKYLKEEKIGKYKNHYFLRFHGPFVAEAYVMEGTKVLEIAIEKLYARYHSTQKRKDPRLGFSVTKSELEKYGRKIK